MDPSATLVLLSILRLINADCTYSKINGEVKIDCGSVHPISRAKGWVRSILEGLASDASKINLQNTPLIAIPEDFEQYSKMRLEEVIIEHGANPNEVFTSVNRIPSTTKFALRYCKAITIQTNQLILDLKDADFSHNLISRFSNQTIYNIRNVEILDLSHNKFKDFDTIALFPKVQFLNVTENMIEKFTIDHKSRFIHLTDLIMFGNPLLLLSISEPRYAPVLESVKLDCVKNLEYTFQELARIPSLVTLVENGCGSDEMNFSIVDKIEWADSIGFTNAHFNHIPRGNRFTRFYIKNLHLSSNPGITSIGEDDFKNWQALSYIDLCGCSILTIHSNAFAYLSNLVAMKLAKNHLRNLSPPLFNTLIRMTHLDLSFNPLGTLDINLFEENRKMVYLGIRKVSIPSIELKIFQDKDDFEFLDIRDNGFDHTLKSELIKMIPKLKVAI